MFRSNISVHEIERLEALHALQLLDTDPEERFDRITRVARVAFNVPAALISLVDRERLWFKSGRGLEVKETAVDGSFCAHAVGHGKPLVVADAATDPRFKDASLVVDKPHVRFYAGHPLRGPNGHFVGTLCLLDWTPRALAQGEWVLLADLAAIVERELQHGLNARPAKRASGTHVRAPKDAQTGKILG